MSNDMQSISYHLPYFCYILDLQIVLKEPDKNPPSLKDVVKRLFKVDMDKTMQRTDWLQRPLTDEMKKYAMDDAIWTDAVYRRCLDDIQQCHHTESEQLYERHRWPTRSFDVSDFGLGDKVDAWKVIGFVLWAARERIAERMDVNIGKICSKENLKTVIEATFRAFESKGKVPLSTLSLFRCDPDLMLDEVENVFSNWNEEYDPTKMSTIPYPLCMSALYIQRLALRTSQNQG